MAIPDHIIDQIQEKTDIVEVISRYIQLKKTGRNYKSTCPFHHEKTPSFVVSPDKQIYHCFGCGAGGNVFSFLMRYENLQFPEVAEMLAKSAGVALPHYSSRREEGTSFANQFYKINEYACQFFQTCLANNNAAKDYLNLRGVADTTISKFRIGYAPDAWESILNAFKKKGVGENILEKAGIIVSNEKGGYYDRFRHRIIFPIMDLKDRILGFGARVLDSSLPKYINSPETPIYSKGRNLYGFNLSKGFIKKEGYALIVEGYLDFIIPYQAGIQNIIATLGTALTVDQAKLIKRFVNTVIMVYDPDEAGEAASLRNLDMFITEDINVYIAELTSGLDPDGYIRKFGAEDFLKLVKSSKNLFDYKLDKLEARFDKKTTHGKAGIAAQMLPTIARINNAIAKSELVKKLAERLSVDEESIRTELKKVKQDYGERRPTVTALVAKKDSKVAEIMMLALLLEGEHYIDIVQSKLSLDELKDTSIRDIVSAIFTLHKERRGPTPARLISHLGNSATAADLISEAVNTLEGLTDKDRALSDCIALIKKDNFKDRLNMLQDEIRLAHSKKDEDRENKLLSEYNELVKAGKT